MKKTTLIILSTLVAPVLFASEDIMVTKTFKSANKDLGVVVKSKAVRSSDTFIIGGLSARLAAISEAKNKALNYIGTVCVNGRNDAFTSTRTNECNTLDNDANETECIVTTTARCKPINGIKSVDGLNAKLGVIPFSTACLDRIEEKEFNLNETVVNFCNEIKNELQYECVEKVTSYRQLFQKSIYECSKIESPLAIDVLRLYSGELDPEIEFVRPTSKLIHAVSKVDTEDEKTCFMNNMKLDQINADYLISECTTELQETTNEFMENLEDGIDSLIDRIGEMIERT